MVCEVFSLSLVNCTALDFILLLMIAGFQKGFLTAFSNNITRDYILQYVKDISRLQLLRIHTALINQMCDWELY
jgi:hypothetical protein